MKNLWAKKQKVQLMQIKKTDRIPYFVNMPKILSKKNEYIEKKGKKIYIAKYYHKFNIDIA